MMKIFVLANTILYKKAVSGGDIVAPQLMRHLRAKTRVYVIGNKLTQNIWRSLRVHATFFLYKNTFLDRYDSIVFAPMKYLVRTVKACSMLISKLKALEEGAIVYTSSDLFPDIIPAYIARVRYPRSRWIANIYYVNDPPFRREGNPFFALFSFLSQQIGFFLIKKRADKIFVLRAAKEAVLRQGFPPAKLEITHTGIDISTVKHIPYQKKRYDAIFIGSLTVARGAFELLNIWRLVVNTLPKATLAIIGGGDDAIIKNYSAQINKLNIRKNIFFIGFVPKQKDVFSYIKASKICLSPRLEGGWDMPTLEASALGVPVVSYQMGKKSIPFKKSLTVVPLYDQKAFAQATIELITNNKKRNALSNWAIREAEKYNWSNIAGKFEKVIYRLNAPL